MTRNRSHTHSHGLAALFVLAALALGGCGPEAAETAGLNSGPSLDRSNPDGAPGTTSLSSSETGLDGGVGVGDVSPGASLAVTWTFPALIPDATRGDVFPTYMAHLLGTHIDANFPTDLVCADIVNPSAAPTLVRLIVTFAVYAQDAALDTVVAARAHSHVCLTPAFDLAKLYALSDATIGRIEVELKDGATSIASAMKAIALAPVSDIAWAVPGLSRSDALDLSAVFVTPKASAIDQLQRAASEYSDFGGFGGGDPYERVPYTREASLAAGSWTGEETVLEAGETLAWSLPGVTAGLNQGVEIDLFTDAQFQAWQAGSGTDAVAVWTRQQTGAGAVAPALSAGPYVLVVSNVMGTAPVTVDWRRTVTRYDVASDVLESVFGALQDQGTTYSSIPTSYFDSWQHVRRVDDVLNAHSANCIDGSLVFASVLELLGMEPVLIFKTGHVYAGVRSAPGSSVIWPIETTMVGTAKAGDAMATAMAEMVNDRANDPRFHILDIATMRARNVLPQPQ